MRKLLLLALVGLALIFTAWAAAVAYSVKEHRAEQAVGHHHSPDRQAVAEPA